MPRGVSGARTNQYQRNIAMLSPQFRPAPHAGELSSLFSSHIQQSLSGQFPPVIITVRGYQVLVGHYIMGPGDHPIAPGLTMWPVAELISIQSNKGSFSSPSWRRHKGWKAVNLTPEEHGAQDEVLTGLGQAGSGLEAGIMRYVTARS